MNEVRLAVVGLGAWGKNLLRAFSAIGRARVTAVCDRDRSRVAEVAWGDKSILRSTELAQLVGERCVDAIVLATPPAVHAEHCRTALDHGKHVFVEKPFTSRLADAEQIERQVRSSSCKLMVGHILRYHPALLRLSAAIERGELGELRSVHSQRLGASALTTGEAAWWSLAPHDLSVMRSLFGAEPSSIRARLEHTDENPKAVRATLSFGHERVGTITVSPAATKKTRRIVVVGSRRTAVFDDTSTGEKLFIVPSSAHGSFLAQNEAAFSLVRSAAPLSPDEPLLEEARHFISAILDDTPILTDAAEGRAVVAVLEAGVLSLHRNGRIVPIGATESDLASSARA